MSIYQSSKVLPYVYQCVHKETGQFYIGYRCANKVPSSEDLGKHYFTSSNYVSNNFNQFNYHIIAEFFNKFQAYEFEQNLIRENWGSKLLLNRSYAGIYLIDKKGIPTGPCSELRKHTISIKRKLTRKITCKHCNKNIDPGNFKLYHGDNCKLNPNIDQLVLKARSEKARKSTKKSIENGTYKHRSPTSFGVLICPHCGKEGKNIGSMKKFHFDRCPKMTGIKNNPIQLPKCSCIKCHRVLDIANFSKHSCKA